MTYFPRIIRRSLIVGASVVVAFVLLYLGVQILAFIVAFSKAGGIGAWVVLILLALLTLSIVRFLSGKYKAWWS